MKPKLRWGLLATGVIARKFARGLTESETGVLSAIGSRSHGSAERFASEFPARAHGSYEALLEDTDVDAVYISTPHPSHAEWAIKAAQAGKHILCEKPLTMNHAEAVAVVEAARANDVFLMEAFMYRCHPQTTKLVELVRSGVIGEVRAIQGTFSFAVPENLEGRLFKQALGGGGILDVGCYCASMARLVAGAASGKPHAEPISLSALAWLGPESHVDRFSVATLLFDDGILAQLACGVRASLSCEVHIGGTEGHLFIPHPWTIPFTSKIMLQRNGRAAPEEIEIHGGRDVYAIEADTVAAHLEAREAPAMPWSDSLGNMQTLDRWRAEAGVVYDADKPGA